MQFHKGRQNGSEAYLLFPTPITMDMYVCMATEADQSSESYSCTD